MWLNNIKQAKLPKFLHLAFHWQPSFTYMEISGPISATILVTCRNPNNVTITLTNPLKTGGECLLCNPLYPEVKIRNCLTLPGFNTSKFFYHLKPPYFQNMLCNKITVSASYQPTTITLDPYN